MMRAASAAVTRSSSAPDLSSSVLPLMPDICLFFRRGGLGTHLLKSRESTIRRSFLTAAIVVASTAVSIPHREQVAHRLHRLNRAALHESPHVLRLAGSRPAGHRWAGGGAASLGASG